LGLKGEEESRSKMATLAAGEAEDFFFLGAGDFVGKSVPIQAALTSGGRCAICLANTESAVPGLSGAVFKRIDSTWGRDTSVR
jgi:hypothetical protein